MVQFKRPIAPARFAPAADWLLVAVAFVLPWSTSATGILLVLWLLALIPSLEWDEVRREVVTPAGGLPVVLFLFAALGMAWADVSWSARWGGLDAFIKLLVIPLLFAQFRRSGNGHRVFLGFLGACILLLIASWLVTIWPSLPKGSRDTGVAVKSYIAQSVEFTICAAVLLHIVLEAARRRRWMLAAACLGLAIAFLADIFFIATSRTALVVIAVLVLLYGARRFGWKGFLSAAVLGVAVAAALWISSPYLRDRVTGIFSETESFEAQNVRTPSGERLMFWTRSLRIVQDAPIFGHGTGSIDEMFRRAAAGHTGARGEATSNPHNQTFAVAIQLGLAGTALLWAMWLAQLVLFRGGGLVDWIGLVIVAQNVVGSLFNSHLFDFTEGWLYVIGVGVVAGMVRRQSALPSARAP